ncbi:MAG TPA: DUF1465 family protein [Alphaproteobacteria bacterium]|nr:DUF1465 family protein [Alphaproteobacteria bacterium]
MSASTGTTAFFNRTYDETMALLVEARNYVAHQEATDRQRLAAPARLRVSAESMRVTSRLTQVMAWLLAQKAVHAGELTAEAVASDDYALSGAAVCREPGAVDDPELPSRLRGLLDRSHRLYVRVARLDEAARRRTLS